MRTGFPAIVSNELQTLWEQVIHEPPSRSRVDLRRAALLAGTHARESAMPPEQLIISIKQTIRVDMTPADIAERRGVLELRDELVSMSIVEYYRTVGSPSAGAPRDGRTSDRP